MTKEKMMLRSLGYLKLPPLMKKRFGLNSKRKERLRIFPEPSYELQETDEELRVIYKWKKRQLEEYVRTVRGVKK